MVFICVSSRVNEVTRSDGTAAGVGTGSDDDDGARRSERDDAGSRCGPSTVRRDLEGKNQRSDAHGKWGSRLEAKQAHIH